MPSSEIKKVKLDYSFDPKAPGKISSNSTNNQINDISYYTPVDKVYFGSEITEKVRMIDPFVNSAMGFLSFVDGAGIYLGNNLVALSGFIGKEDEAMGVVDNIGKNWSSLFEENGLFSDINNAAEIKYNDEGWKFGSDLGHASAVGFGRLAEMIPYVGPYLSNALTLGDGYGSAYRMARENGIDKETSRYIGIGYGTIETLSFGFSGILTNVGIGTSMPFLETLIETIAENGPEETFFERYSENFEANGGLPSVGISALLYGLNGAASMKVKTREQASSGLISDVGEGIDANRRIKEATEDALSSPFVTTSLNSYLKNIFKDIEIKLSTDVPSVRPV